MTNIMTTHDLATGEVDIREMTAEEIKHQEELNIAIQVDRNSQIAKRNAVLERLGITEEEAKLLLS